VPLLLYSTVHSYSRQHWGYVLWLLSLNTKRSWGTHLEIKVDKFCIPDFQWWMVWQFIVQPSSSLIFNSQHTKYGQIQALEAGKSGKFQLAPCPACGMVLSFLRLHWLCFSCVRLYSFRLSKLKERELTPSLWWSRWTVQYSSLRVLIRRSNIKSNAGTLCKRMKVRQGNS